MKNKFIVGMQVELNYKIGDVRYDTVGTIVCEPGGRLTSDEYSLHYEAKYYNPDGAITMGLFKESEIDHMMPSKPHRMRSVHCRHPSMSKTIKSLSRGCESASAMMLRLIQEGQDKKDNAIKHLDTNWYPWIAGDEVVYERKGPTALDVDQPIEVMLRDNSVLTGTKREYGWHDYGVHTIIAYRRKATH